MERWGGPKGVAPEPAGRPGRRYADQPSFSSTLLDAIYKSMDEPNDNGAAVESLASAAATKTKKRQEDEALHYRYRASLAGSSRVTSSSSDCSSYGGFSSSEAESSQQHRRLRPIRTTTTTVSSSSVPAAPEMKKAAAAAGKKTCKEKPGAAIRAKLRDLRKPASPGARLAGFLNSIFAGGGGSGSKQRTPPPPPRVAAAESACSTASSSSYSRSCLSKTPSTRGQPRRTVRFLDTDLVEAAAPPVSRRVQVGVVHLEQMLLRRMEMESDDDDDEDEDSSDASSDLFELESLAGGAPAAAAAAYRDELPVYETTRVVPSRSGIGQHGYAAHGRSTARVV